MVGADRSAVLQAAKLSFAATCLIVTIKVIGAVLSGSVSVAAEAVQSGIDVLVSGAVVQTVKWASRPADEDHPYGHGKAELLLSAGQAILILGSSGWILYQASLRLLQPQPIQVGIGVAAMGLAVSLDAIVAWHLRRVAQRTGSAALQGESAHLTGDLLAGLGILVGLGLVSLTGKLWLDPICALIFAGAAGWMAYRQARHVAHLLIDGALPEDDLAKVVTVLEDHPEAMGYHALRTRTSGGGRYVEFHLLLDDHLTFVQAHELTEEIEGEISRVLGGAVVNIHYEPYRAEMEHQRIFHSDE